MRTVVNGRAFLTFGQIYVESGDERPDFDDSFRGQQNGLCGAAIAGTLCLMTGLHTGHVGLIVEVCDEAPVIDETWEDIVEAPFRPAGDATVYGFDSSDWWELGLEPADYRVRYCGRAIDTGRESDDEKEWDDPPIDHYLLQFWPAPPEPDQVIKVTSRMARDSHDRTRRMRPPATPDEIATAQARREEWAADQLRARELESWGGTLPSERIRETYHAFQLVKFDRPLLDDLDRADDELLIAVARWAARQTCAAAELDQMQWVADALDRMDAGVDERDVIQAPPGTFGTENLAIATFGGWDSGQTRLVQALLAIQSPYDEPLDAALSTLWMAIGAYGEWRGTEVIAKLRLTFPQLGEG
ncbi:hypothetical protein E1263_30495 [Kribbella antibiotica]|uniref:Uncharacterized protein n=1 Tax=Kribbella antibiotica TaxID=190195 RepID=A0A4R4Z212_9ACTN|nr:hypothetical protein [Kribbella antibiotica]TDD50889.1 hypothetical protein E1263_30495 [Kribbella antibiotica]